MIDRRLLVLFILSISLTLGGCNNSYRPKNEAERMIVEFCSRNAVEWDVMRIEYVEDIAYGEKTLKKYRVSLRAVSDRTQRTTLFMYYEPQRRRVYPDQ